MDLFMTTQIDHKEARRHVDTVRCGGRTWMSDLEPIEIIEGLLAVYDEDISALFDKEALDEAVEEAVDKAKEELADEHKEEIDKLTGKHEDALHEVREVYRQDIIDLTEVLHGKRVQRFDELDDEQLRRLDERELREAYAALRVHHIQETSALLMSGKMVAFPTDPVRCESIRVIDGSHSIPLDPSSSLPVLALATARKLPELETVETSMDIVISNTGQWNHMIKSPSSTSSSPIEPSPIEPSPIERFRAGEAVPIEDFLKHGSFPRLGDPHRDPLDPDPDTEVVITPPTQSVEPRPGRGGRRGRPPKVPKEPKPPKPPKAPRKPTPSSVGTLPIIATVLREAGIGVVLSVRDIVARAGDRLPTKSVTPETVVSRDLAMDIKIHGDASRFRRLAPGMFGLADRSADAPDAPQERSPHGG